MSNRSNILHLSLFCFYLEIKCHFLICRRDILNVFCWLRKLLFILVVENITFVLFFHWYRDMHLLFLNAKSFLNFFFFFFPFKNYYYYFYFTILYWFCHTSTWVCHKCTHVPNPEPLSHLVSPPPTCDVLCVWKWKC